MGMVPLVVVGTVALDTVRTPFGETTEALGGAASYAAYAASFFVKPGVVAVVGDDFPDAYWSMLEGRASLEGVQRSSGKTFRWKGYYEHDMNAAHTVATQLNVFAQFKPVIPEAYRDAPFLFLANSDPVLQRSVLEQMEKPFSILDTMNYWITNARAQLLETIRKVDVLLLNDAEARQLFNTPNVIAAGKQALSLGPRACIIKKGEHGVLLFAGKEICSLPGYPLEVVKDPTGAGDAFAGAFAAYLAKHGAGEMRKAMVYGSVLASFTVEDFSLGRLKNINVPDIEQRYRDFGRLIEF